MPVAKKTAIVPALTDRQNEIHEYMLAYQAEHGMPPTVREIAEHFGFTSTNGVIDHLKALERKGHVKHRELIARGWRAV